MSTEALPFEDYLKREALSASGAKKLLKAAALYRFDRDHPSESTATFDFGKAAHKEVLGDGDPLEVLHFPAWNAAGAKAAKAQAVAAGRIPILLKDWEVVLEMAKQVKQHPHAAELLAKGEAEVSMFWTDEDTGVQCKARADWITRIEGVLTVVDYKTTRSAAPEDFRRACRSFGYDLQCAWYLEAVRAVYGEEAEFKFIAQEKTAPYLTSVVSLSDLDIADADCKAREARETYARCMKTGVWPGYGTYTVDLPPSYSNDYTEDMVI